MFRKWFHIFSASGSETLVNTETATGGGGPPPAKDIGFLMDQVVTDDNKLRIVIST